MNKASCGSSTHPVGWARKQRLPHASHVSHELGVGRQLGFPVSLHRVSFWVPTVRPVCQGIVVMLNDNFCALDTHSHTHAPTQTSIVCGIPSSTPIHPEMHTQVLITGLGIHSLVHAFIQQGFCCCSCLFVALRKLKVY